MPLQDSHRLKPNHVPTLHTHDVMPQFYASAPTPYQVQVIPPHHLPPHHLPPHPSVPPLPPHLTVPPLRPHLLLPPQHLVPPPPYPFMPATPAYHMGPVPTTATYPGLLSAAYQPGLSPSYPVPPIHPLPGYQPGLGLVEEDDDLGFMDEYLQTHLAAGLGVYNV